MIPGKVMRKKPDVLDEVEKIQQRQIQYDPNAFSSFSGKYLSSHIWLELLSRTRTFASPQFRAEIDELRHEIDTLKLMVKSLTGKVESSNNRVDEVSKTILHKYNIRQKGNPSLSELCNAYVEIVSKIEITQEVYIVDTSSGPVCWTIVDSEPFDSTILEPIYQAQIQMYRETTGNSELEFHVLNLSELLDRQDQVSILPPDAELVWQR